MRASPRSFVALCCCASAAAADHCCAVHCDVCRSKSACEMAPVSSRCFTRSHSRCAWSSWLCANLACAAAAVCAERRAARVERRDDLTAPNGLSAFDERLQHLAVGVGRDARLLVRAQRSGDRQVLRHRPFGDDRGPHAHRRALVRGSGGRLVFAVTSRGERSERADGNPRGDEGKRFSHAWPGRTWRRSARQGPRQDFVERPLPLPARAGYKPLPMSPVA